MKKMTGLRIVIINVFGAEGVIRGWIMKNESVDTGNCRNDWVRGTLAGDCYERLCQLFSDKFFKFYFKTNTKVLVNNVEDKISYEPVTYKFVLYVPIKKP